MATSQAANLSDILRELAEFINDGIAGYERAASESKNPQFQSYYLELATQRRSFSSQVNNLIMDLGAAPESDTTIKGKFYRGWMDVKAALSGNDERAILDSNIYGEEWAQKAYNDALDNPGLSADLRSLLEKQRIASLDAYNHQKQMRDSLL